MHDRKATENPTDPDRDTGKTCLDGCMHCPNASSIVIYRKVSRLTGLYYLVTFCSFCDRYSSAGPYIPRRPTVHHIGGSIAAYSIVYCTEDGGRKVKCQKGVNNSTEL